MRLELLSGLAVMLLAGDSASAQLVRKDWGTQVDGYRIHPDAEPMTDLPLGPFARLPNGHLITVEDGPAATHAIISADEGQTWEKSPIFAEPEKLHIRPERALLCTKQGTVIVAFMNDVERADWNWNPEIHDSPGAR
jgi:sialidase-1